MTLQQIFQNKDIYLSKIAKLKHENHLVIDRCNIMPEKFKKSWLNKGILSDITFLNCSLKKNDIRI